MTARNTFQEFLLARTAKQAEWLFDTLFNELYHDHPELWSWIKMKHEEFKRLV